jgi:oxygen-independent coproporphyrinogen III oxidase
MAADGVAHLYVHLPFCAHRCGYCDFVTAVGRSDEHGAYVDALLGEFERERAVLADPLRTVFVGGGTPTYTALDQLTRVLRALPAATEVTVEANPETVNSDLAGRLRDCDVTRVSIGAQSFQPHLLDVLERGAGPTDVRCAVQALREAGFSNISLDLIYGIPGQTVADLAADLIEAIALEPEHMSWYELEAKPGTRFTHGYGAELERQADAMEEYYEQVVETLTDAGYRWYETANFCLASDGERRGDLRSQHNLGYWTGNDYLGIGVGAVSTLAGLRRTNKASISNYVRAHADGRVPLRQLEPLEPTMQQTERLMLGLRLDEGVELASIQGVLDRDAVRRMGDRGMVDLRAVDGVERVRLTRRGRFVGDAVTAELLSS